MNRILVIHRGSLGDFLLLLPALSAIRQRFPEARIEAIGHTEILSLVCPGIVDSTGSIERSTLVPFFEKSAHLPDAEARYFASLDTVLAYLSDPGKILERNLARLGIRNLMVRPPFPPAGERVHVGKYLFDTVAPLLGPGPAPGCAVGQPGFLRFTDDEIRQAEVLLEPARAEEGPTVNVSRDCDGDCPKNYGGRLLPRRFGTVPRAKSRLNQPSDTFTVALHPGSGSEAKCWPPERFETLARQLAERAGHAIVLILGPADERLVERMTTLAEKTGAVIAHNLRLRLLTAVLSRCNAYVGNDSGVTHLAAATGIPTVAIFGPTDPAVWAPLGGNVRVVSAAAECSPCARERMRRCRERACLAEIEVEAVARAAERPSVIF